MKFAYPFQVAVHHALRVKVVQAVDDVQELRADIEVTREISTGESASSLTNGRRLNWTSVLRNSETFPFGIHLNTRHSG